MATDVNDIYDRMQQQMNLEEMTDENVRGFLESGFKRRETSLSGTVDLTKAHTITEWKDNVGGQKREKKVQGVRFTSRFDSVVRGLQSIKNSNVDSEVESILEKENNRRIGRLPTDEDINRLSERLEKFEGAKPDVRETKQDATDFLEQDREFQRTIGEVIAEREDIADSDVDEVRDLLGGKKEERKQAIKSLRKFAPQRLGGFTKAERRRGVEALAKLDKLF